MPPDCRAAWSHLVAEDQRAIPRQARAPPFLFVCRVAISRRLLGIVDTGRRGRVSGLLSSAAHRPGGRAEQRERAVDHRMRGVALERGPLAAASAGRAESEDDVADHSSGSSAPRGYCARLVLGKGRTIVAAAAPFGGRASAFLVAVEADQSSTARANRHLGEALRRSPSAAWRARACQPVYGPPASASIATSSLVTSPPGPQCFDDLPTTVSEDVGGGKR